MPQNRFTPENVPALVAVGVVEGPGLLYGESTQERLTLSIDSSGVLRCESALGFSATVRVNDAINTANTSSSEDGQVELQSPFVNVVLSDGTAIDCEGALYLSNCQMLLFAKEAQYGWFWFEVRPSFKENAIQLVG